MAYIQRVNPPTNKIIPFNLMNYSGGFNNRSSILLATEGTDMRNMQFYDQVILEKRRGSEVIDTHSEVPYFLHEYMPYTSANQLVIAGNNSVTFHGDTNTTITLNNKMMDGENFMGRYFFVDGNKLRVYSLWTGIVASTYVRVVGSAPLASTAMEVVSTPGTYTALDNTHKQGVTVYDFTAGKIWYEPCANEKADPYLGVSTVPDKPRYIASLKGRMYLSGDDVSDDWIYISQTGNPFYFPPSTGLQIPPNSDKIMGLVIYDDSVVIGRKNDIHVITGVTNNPDLGAEMFRLTRLNTHTGFVSNRCANVAHNYLFFLGWDGNAYAMSSARSDAKVLSTVLISKQINLHGLPFSFNQEDLSNSVSYFYNNVWYVSIKGFVLLYDYRIQAWTVWDNLNIRSFYNRDNVLIWGDDNKDICQFSLNYLDKGKPFYAFWQSSSLDMGDAITYKQFRDFFVLAHTFAGYDSDVRFSLELDYVGLQGSVEIGMQQLIWGTARFGDKYVKGNVNASAPFTIGRRARTIKVRLMNGYAYKGTVASNAELLLLSASDGDMYLCTEDNYYNVWHADTKTWETGFTAQSLNQPMRVYQVNGEYELRGKR